MQRHTQNSSITFEQPMLICAEAHQSSQARRDQVISAEEWRVGWQELEALRGSEEEMKWKMNLGGCQLCGILVKLEDELRCLSNPS
ncbi:hypothetical protein O3P69_019863 [Scylla paramamosain]|uniref:Uncharacterized protein n=1 Tax=Scylla paramamosain TaxID=85552 RepID=A0AAW0SES1_SCYPA